MKNSELNKYISEFKKNNPDRPKLNLNMKKKWIRRLRSGKYKQTESVLKNDRGFCCLGVYGDGIINDYRLRDKVVLTDIKECPKLFKKFLSTEAHYSTIEDAFVELNDTKKATFKQIATFVNKVF